MVQPEPEEQFEIYDDAGCLLGRAPRSRVHREGLWHRTVNVFLFRSDGRLIIQQRQQHKDVCPGLWDLSVAEHVQPGETCAQAAARGLREELAVIAVTLEPIGEATAFCLEQPERSLRDCEVQQCFRGVYDGPLAPDAEEVGATDALSRAALSKALAQRPDAFTPWFRQAEARLRDRLWPA